jgi:hypothetical protein
VRGAAERASEKFTKFAIYGRSKPKLFLGLLFAGLNGRNMIWFSILVGSLGKQEDEECNRNFPRRRGDWVRLGMCFAGESLRSDPPEDA